MPGQNVPSQTQNEQFAANIQQRLKSDKNLFTDFTLALALSNIKNATNLKSKSLAISCNADGSYTLKSKGTFFSKPVAITLAADALSSLAKRFTPDIKQPPSRIHTGTGQAPLPVHSRSAQAAPIPVPSAPPPQIGNFGNVNYSALSAADIAAAQAQAEARERRANYQPLKPPVAPTPQRHQQPVLHSAGARKATNPNPHARQFGAIPTGPSATTTANPHARQFGAIPTGPSTTSTTSPHANQFGKLPTRPDATASTSAATPPVVPPRKPGGRPT